MHALLYLIPPTGHAWVHPGMSGLWLSFFGQQPQEMYLVGVLFMIPVTGKVDSSAPSKFWGFKKPDSALSPTWGYRSKKTSNTSIYSFSHDVLVVPALFDRSSVQLGAEITERAI